MSEIRLGVIGAGYFGKHYVRLLQEVPGVGLRMVAAASSRTLSLHDLSSSVTKTRRWQDVVEDAEIDGVIIATPPSTHFQIAKAALEAGKHVLLEKPMAMSLKEARILGTLVKKHKRVFLVGHQYLYNNYVWALKAAIAAKALGRIHYVLAENLYFGPIRHDIGCFWETATHELALIDYLFEPKKIINVRGMGQHFFDRRDDFTATQIRFPEGFMATIVTSWWAPEKTRKFLVAGDKGFAVFDDVKTDEKLKFLFYPYPRTRKGGTSSTFLNKADMKINIPKVKAEEPLRNQIIHFRDCIGTGKMPRTGIEHGIRVTEMLDTISRAVKK